MSKITADLDTLAERVREAHDAIHVHYSEGRGNPVKAEIVGRRELIAAAEALGAAKERAACREAVEETWSYIDEDGERRYDGNIQCPDCLAAIDARGTP